MRADGRLDDRRRMLPDPLRVRYAQVEAYSALSEHVDEPVAALGSTGNRHQRLVAEG